MRKIFLVALLIAVIACAGVLVALVAFGIISLPGASRDETVIAINDMYLAEIPVYEPTDLTGSFKKGVKLGLEFSLEKDVENAILEYFSVLVYSENQQYSPSAFIIFNEYYDDKGYWNETDPVIPSYTMKLPIKCIFEWQPQWDDGTRGYGISRPHVLPPLNQSGFTVRVTALRIRWLEDGEWKSESFSDVSEEIIEFELPVLNTLTLKGNPSLSEIPIAPDVYP